MAPNASGNDLLYISTPGQEDDIWVYTYPQGDHVGTLVTPAPQGLCSDAAGNVFITTLTSQIIEYAHGGTSPIATLSDPGYYPHGCAVDPKTGNLAVTNLDSSTKGGGRGSLAVYKQARGLPTVHKGSKVDFYYYCGYDNAGNLYADGLHGRYLNSRKATFALAELRKGSRKLENVVLNEHIYSPSAVQWDGQYMAIGDAYGSYKNPSIYDFTISGGVGSVEGSMPLQDWGGPIGQFWIQDSTVIGPRYDNVGLWSYPDGGNPVSTIPLTGAFGATVSVAP